jgi:hypothetical protein
MATIVTRSGKGSALTVAEMDANFTNLNSNKLEKDGSISMTGLLTLSGNPSSNLHAAPKQYVDAGDIMLQRVRTDVTAFAGGAGLIPLDDTIPQISEGNLVMSLSITPKRADSYLTITVSHPVSASVAAWIISAIFRDSEANALAATNCYEPNAGGAKVMSYSVKVPSSSTAAKNFTVRVGLHIAGNAFINGVSARTLGGVCASSIMIEETTN